MTPDLRTRAEQHAAWLTGANRGVSASLVRELVTALDAAEQREQALREQLAEAEARAFEAGIGADITGGGGWIFDNHLFSPREREEAYRAYQQSRQG